MGQLCDAVIIGATFPLTGEGIGKAMETGILGAETSIYKHDLGRSGGTDLHAKHRSPPTQV